MHGEAGVTPPPRGKKWSARDNAIAEAEVELSALLTAELSERPAISLSLLFFSRPVQERVYPILVRLEGAVGKRLHATTTEVREGQTRHVYVTIHDN